LDFLSNTVYDIIFLLALLFGAALRIVPLFLFRIENIDSFYHLTAARQIWNEKKIPSSLNSFLIKGTYSYPPLLHFLLAPIVGKNKKSLALIISPIFDILSAILIYYVIQSNFNTEVALISSVLFLFIPFTVIESMSLTPRSIGSFFIIAYYFLVSFTIVENIIFELILASICVAVVLLSHKMATQSLIFSGLFLTLAYVLIDVETSIFVITTLILGSILSFIISKGYYRKVFRGHKAMLLYHFKHGNYFGEKKFGNPIQIIKLWPWLILLIIAIFLDNFYHLYNDENLLFLLIWGLFFIGLSIVWRYGDNYRYLVYAMAPISIVFANIILQLQELTIIFIGISLFLSFARIGLFIRKQRKNPLISTDLHNCFKYIVNQDKITSIACIPSTINYPAAFYTHKKILAAEAAPEPWENGIDYSNYVSKADTILELINKFQTKIFLVNSQDQKANEFENAVANSSLVDHKVLFHSGSYKIYELKSL